MPESLDTNEKPTIARKSPACVHLKLGEKNTHTVHVENPLANHFATTLTSGENLNLLISILKWKAKRTYACASTAKTCLIATEAIFNFNPRSTKKLRSPNQKLSPK